MDYALGTWNVRTLNKPEAVRSLLQEISKYNLKIVALQKTKWLSDAGEEDVEKILEVRNWKRKMLDRQIWRGLIQKVN
ncbi:hypothetical protein ANN_21268 [Periplaneta americana]|uniref:Uncharacterized protein n=1 Tax=Periplaneta americana TaxID=6978 RepID=A0ABQ8SFZ7_PERAM|nr:hypothetical protein ANN_21268 [Periplaneta americana]